MKIFKLIKQKVHNFFHPSFEEGMRRFGIVEDFYMSEEDRDRCIEMIEQRRKKLKSRDNSKEDKG